MDTNSKINTVLLQVVLLILICIMIFMIWNRRHIEDVCGPVLEQVSLQASASKAQ